MCERTFCLGSRGKPPPCFFWLTAAKKEMQWFEYTQFKAENKTDFSLIVIIRHLSPVFPCCITDQDQVNKLDSDAHRYQYYFCLSDCQNEMWRWMKWHGFAAILLQNFCCGREFKVQLVLLSQLISTWRSATTPTIARINHLTICNQAALLKLKLKPLNHVN